MVHGSLTHLRRDDDRIDRTIYGHDLTKLEICRHPPPVQGTATFNFSADIPLFLLRADVHMRIRSSFLIV
jgi:hypothetical protein